MHTFARLINIIYRARLLYNNWQAIPENKEDSFITRIKERQESEFFWYGIGVQDALSISGEEFVTYISRHPWRFGWNTADDLMVVINRRETA